MDSRWVKCWVASVALFGGLGVFPASGSEKPNIIFVFTDDLGFGDLGCYGNRKIKTPSIDKMATEGILFSNFTVSSPVCSPSRTAIMTGHYPARDRVHYAFGGSDAHNQQFRMPNYLDPKQVLLTHLFQSAGYKTAQFGKWHLGKTPDSPLVHDYGIDEVKIHTGSVVDHSEYCYRGVKNWDKTKTVVDLTIDFVERHKDQPFFINCWISDPHSPLQPSEEQLAAYPELKSQVAGFTSATQVYSAVVTDMDKHVGRLLDRLDELGLSANTLVVFSSDNGPAPIFGIDTAHSGTGSVGPLRGCKASLYEGGIRVPFIVRWPGTTPANQVDDRTIITAVDLLPTFCNLAGIDLPAGYTADGVDMTKAFKGIPQQREKPIMWEFRFSPWGLHLQKSPALAMRDGDWKLMMNPDGSRVELYNLKENVCEMDNRASEFPQIVERMSQQLLEWRKSLPDSESIPKNAGSFNYPWPTSDD
jgi:N-acetylgalactosamine-6-sulfatase